MQIYGRNCCSKFKKNEKDERKMRASLGMLEYHHYCKIILFPYKVWENVWCRFAWLSDKSFFVSAWLGEKNILRKHQK